MKNQLKTLLVSSSLAVVCLLLSPGRVMAQSLSNGGSTVSFNLGGGSGAIGMNSWTVDTDPSQSQLDEQWFWYSIVGQPGVSSIDQLSAATIISQTQNYLDVYYGNSQIGVEATYDLNGVNSGTADIMENVYVYNLTGSAFTVNLFEYSNFNLYQNSENTVQIYGSPGQYSEAEQSEGVTAIAQGIASPLANNAETGLAGNVLTDVGNGSLNDNTYQGAGNDAWAFEWTSTVNGGQNLAVIGDQELSIATVPEPSSMALIGLGLGACGLACRRQFCQH